MTLEEAIQHCREKAKELEEQAQSLARRTKYSNIPDCLECAAEHQQLAEWLEELKARREKEAKHGGKQT